MRSLPVPDSDDALQRTWIEFAIQNHSQRTYYNTFFASLQVTPTPWPRSHGSGAPSG